MAEILTNNKNYLDIADTIRQMKNVNTTYKPREMASALKDIYSNEVEGLPPLSFEANGNNLLNYKIDGAIGGVGDRTSNLFDKNNPTMLTELYMSVTGLANVTSSYSHSIVIPCTPATTYSIKFKYETYTLRIASFSSYPTANKVGNDVNNVANGTPCNNASYTTSETANYLLIFCYNVATPESSNYSIDEFFSEIIVSESQIPLPYEPYGYKVPVVVNGKNLLDFENPSIKSFNLEKISNGIYQANTNNAFLANRWALDTEAGVQYRILGTTNNSGITIQLSDFINGTSSPQGGQIRADGSINLTFIATGKTTLSIYSKFANQSFTATNFQIYKSSIADTSYEPYIEPTTTNIYLDNPILENESISLSDTNTNIPTIDGTNILTIDTTVQPSNVYIQAPKDSIEATQIANRLEEI